jgi:hypothetical protein
MTTLFIHTDERAVLARWEYAAAVFRIVARDYRQVLTEDIAQDRHHTILLQTGSDLIDIETDLTRVGREPPVGRWEPWAQAAWQALVPLVHEHRKWRIPAPDLGNDLIADALIRRKVLEERFNAVLLRGEFATPEAVEPAVVVTTGGR